MVAEGVITNIAEAKNTSTSYYDTLSISCNLNETPRTIASFGKGQTLNNIQYKNRYITTKEIFISQSTSQGVVPASFTFGFFGLNSDNELKTSVSLKLVISHGTVSGSSGYFRVFMI